MNLLMISTDFPPLLGGISTYASSLSRKWAESGKVIVAAPGFRGYQSCDRRLAREGVQTVRSFSASPLLEADLLRRSLEALNRLPQPKAVFATAWFPAGSIASAVGRLTGTPYYLAAHGSEFLDDRFTLRRRIKSHLRFLKKSTFNRAAGVFAVSSFTAGLLADGGVEPSLVQVVNNGADPEVFRPHPEPERLKKRHDVAGRVVLLSVCRLDRHKGVHLTLTALPRLLRRHPKLLYVVLGEGPEGEHLKEQASRLGVENHVRWLGGRPFEEVVEWYQLCDLHIMLSHTIEGRTDLIEGFGISFLEASSCAKATIGCRFGGVVDAVADGETGLLLSDPPKESEVFEAIDRLLRSPESARKMGLAGRRRVEQDLNWDRAATKMNQTINQTMHQS